MRQTNFLCTHICNGAYA